MTKSAKRATLDHQRGSILRPQSLAPVSFLYAIHAPPLHPREPAAIRPEHKSMKIERTGVILFVELFDECVAFYRDALGLSVEYQKEGLVRFSFGGSYLMLERGGVSGGAEKHMHENPTVVRFDVENVLTTARELQQLRIPVEVAAFEWGVIGIFHDPDGNRCELKNAK